jgi:DNA-binding transcriptional LysR family regulator
MAHTTFDWALIRTFLAVLDAGSFVRAAATLGARQPTLSRQVEALEAQLGVPLFERTGRGVVPTRAGRAIAAAAREMETGSAKLLRVLDEHRESGSTCVRITTSQVAACYLLPRILAAFQLMEPDIQFEIAVSNDISNLLQREADIALRMARPQQASLTARKLAHIPIVACAHRSYLQRMGTPKRPADLMRHRLIGYDRDDTLIQGFARGGAPITRAHFALRTDDHIAYGQLIAAGAGIGFAARYNLRDWPDVVPVLPMLAIPALPCWLAVHREARGNRRLRRVFDYLAEAVRRELTV